MQDIEKTSIFSVTQGNVGKAIVEYAQTAVETFRLIDYVVLFYLIFVLMWIVRVLIEFIKGISSYQAFQPNSILYNLHNATYIDDTPAILELISIDPELINVPLHVDGYTPFLRACYNGNTEVVKAMLQLGADINSCTARLENGFYLAVYNRIRNMTCNNATCVHSLYHAGVDINSPNVKGINAFQLAAMFGHSKMIQWLISKKVEMDLKPSPFVLALSSGYNDAANLLKPYYVD